MTELAAAPVPTTDEQRFFFDLRGWILLPSVLTEGEIEEMKAQCYAGTTKSYEGPLQNLLDHPAVVGILSEILTEEPFERDESYGFRCEGKPGARDHRDHATEAEDVVQRAVGVWWYFGILGGKSGLMRWLGVTQPSLPPYFPKLRPRRCDPHFPGGSPPSPPVFAPFDASARTTLESHRGVSRTSDPTAPSGCRNCIRSGGGADSGRTNRST